MSVSAGLRKERNRDRAEIVSSLEPIIPRPPEGSLEFAREILRMTANCAPAPKSRPGALIPHPVTFRLSTNSRGEPQICRSGHRHDGSVSAYPSLSRARGALSNAPFASRFRVYPFPPTNLPTLHSSFSLSRFLSFSQCTPLCAVHPFRFPSRIVVAGSTVELWVAVQ